MQAKNGDNVKVHYTGKLVSGEQFDSSAGREPLAFTVGAGQMIAGFDEGVIGMKVGETKTLKITPEKAYGEYDPELSRELPVEAVTFTPEIGMQLATDTGLRGIITEVGEKSFIIDFNHELAGKTLIFEVTIVSMEESKE